MLSSISIKDDVCPLTLEDVTSLHDPYTLGMTTFDRETLLVALELEPWHPVTKKAVSAEQIEIMRYRWKRGSFLNKFWVIDRLPLDSEARKEALERMPEWLRLEDYVIEDLKEAGNKDKIRALLSEVKNEYPLFKLRELLEPKYFYKLGGVLKLEDLTKIIDEIEAREVL